MNLDVIGQTRRWMRRCTASGSPFRYFGKLRRSIRNRFARPQLFRTAGYTERELPASLTKVLGALRRDGFAPAGAEWDAALLAKLGAFSEARLSDPRLGELKTELRKFMI